MASSLLRFVLISGIVTVLVLLMPELPVYGFVLLFVPGILLAAAPTVFLWSLVFAVLWAASSAVFGETNKSKLTALVATALVLITVTVPFRAAGEEVYQASLRPEATPTDRIMLHGNIRLDLPEATLQKKRSRLSDEVIFECNELCGDLLFMPGVRTVTINASNGKMLSASERGDGLHANATSYVLMKRSSCTDDLPALPAGLESGGFAGSKTDLAATQSAPDTLPLEAECIVPVGNSQQFDILIREGTSDNGVYSKPWRLTPRGPALKFIEILDQDYKPLLRRFQSRVLVPFAPLYVAYRGGIDTGNIGFGWGTTEIANRPGWYETRLIAELQAHTNGIF